MSLVKPLKFLDAISKFLSRTPVASPMTSAEWSGVPAQVRESSIWSAQQTSAKFVQHFRNLIGDFLQQHTEPAADGLPMIKVGGRNEFVRRMKDFIETEGIPRTGTGIQDIGSSGRLKLIFDVNTQAAENYGYWKAGNDPEILRMWPGRRFFRIKAVKVPRAVHQANDGAVRRKDDMQFWLAMNSPDLGGFGVPWGPWGYNSGMADEDVKMSEMVRLGIMDPGEKVVRPDFAFSAALRQESAALDPDLLAKLKAFHAKSSKA